MDENIDTTNILDVYISLYLTGGNLNTLDLRLHRAPRMFDEYNEMGINGYNKPGAKSWDPTVPKDPGPIISFVSVTIKKDASGKIISGWYNLEIPIDHFNKLVAKTIANNGFMLSVPGDHCTYQRYASRENSDKSKAPKFVIVYGDSVYINSHKNDCSTNLNGLSLRQLGQSIEITLSADKINSKGTATLYNMNGVALYEIDLDDLTPGKNIINLNKNIGHGTYLLSVICASLKKNIKISVY